MCMTNVLLLERALEKDGIPPRDQRWKDPQAPEDVGRDVHDLRGGHVRADVDTSRGRPFHHVRARSWIRRLGSKRPKRRAVRRPPGSTSSRTS